MNTVFCDNNTQTLDTIVMDSCQMSLKGLSLIVRDLSPKINLDAAVNSVTELTEWLRKKRTAMVIISLSARQKDYLPCLSLIQEMKQRWPNVKLMVVTSFLEDRIVRCLYESKVDGAISKQETLSIFRQVLLHVTNGERHFSPQLVERLASCEQEVKQLLSPTELRVVNHILIGQKMALIADELHVSRQTVSSHKRNAMKKLGVRNMAALFALRDILPDLTNGGMIEEQDTCSNSHLIDKCMTLSERPSVRESDFGVGFYLYA